MTWLQDLLNQGTGGAAPVLSQEQLDEEARQVAARWLGRGNGLPRLGMLNAHGVNWSADPGSASDPQARGLGSPPIEDIDAANRAAIASGHLVPGPNGGYVPRGSGMAPDAATYPGIADATGGSATYPGNAAPPGRAARREEGSELRPVAPPAQRFPPPVATDMPPSTNDPMSREPVLFQNGVPLPRPRPAGLGSEPEQPSPMSLAPPDQGALPPNATSTAGTAPPAMPAPASAPGGGGIMDTAGGILGKIFNPANAPLLLAMGGGFAGAPSLGTGMSRGFGAAAPQAALLRREQQGQTNRAETYRALVARGVPPQEAMAAMYNPEILKAVVAKHFETKPPELKEVGRDRWGNPITGVYNAQGGTINGEPAVEFLRRQAAGGGLPPPTLDVRGNPVVPIPIPAAGSASSGDEGAAGDRIPSSARPVAENRNEEYLASLNNSGLASQVKAISEGRAPYPSGQVMRTPYGRMLTEAVASYDPSFDAVNYKARESTRKDFTSGKSAQNLTAFNTAIAHLSSLDKSIDGLRNTNFTDWNKLTGAIAERYDPRFQAALKSFQAARTAVADELTRAFRGTGGNVHDIVQWERTINQADSPPALRSAIKQAAELLRGRIDAVGDQYNRGMGTTKDPLTLLNPQAAAAFQRLHDQDPQRGSAASAAPPNATPAAAAVPRLEPGQTTTINGVTIKRLD